jgi:magnesium and cobalt transporter
MSIISDSEEPLSSPKSLFRKIINYFSRQDKLEETVKEIIEDSHPERKKMTKGEQQILHNFLGFGDKDVSSIMVPRSEIVAIRMDSSLNEIVDLILTRSHTRLPVYKDDLDHICGFINIKDIINALARKSQFSVEKILRKTLTVVPNMRVIDVLTEMQNSQVHIAIVIDEYGATDGMMTIEDIIEELVGELEDEHDVKDTNQEYIKVDNNTIVCSGRMELSKAEKFFGVKLQQQKVRNVETVAGLVLNVTGSLPKNGDIIKISDNLKAEILDATPRYIKRIKLIYNND